MTTRAASEHSPLTIGRGARVFILTGAGISAESGIQTFRDGDGLWEKHRVEDVATPEAFERDPKLVWKFYSERRKQADACSPNPAHLALARLEKQLGERLFLCTQNVDHLHEKAGSSQVLHMHGELFQTRCESCAREPFHDLTLHLESVPRCEKCSAQLRPHIVWFGEIPLELDRIAEALDACDLFLTIGSSGAVYPAAGFVAQVRMPRRNGTRARTIYIGPEAPSNARSFDEIRLGKAGEVLPGLFEVEGEPGRS